MSEVSAVMLATINRKVEALNQKVAEMQKTHVQVLQEEWIDGKTVMSILKIEKRTLQKHRENGTLSYTQYGGKILYKIADVQDLLESHYNKK